jgi:hypothetical protein
MIAYNSPQSAVPYGRDGVPAMHDSGAREMFSTGAMRDVAAAKPMVGLLSPCWLADLVQVAVEFEGQPHLDGTSPLSKAWVYVSLWRDGQRTKGWLALAAWNMMFFVDGRPVSLGLPLPMSLARLVAWLELGAKKYTPRNWEQGIPLARTTESLLRHLLAVAEGDDDEDHAAAVLANMMFLSHTQHMILRGVLPVELDDMPDYQTPQGE